MNILFQISPLLYHYFPSTLPLPCPYQIIEIKGQEDADKGCNTNGNEGLQVFWLNAVAEFSREFERSLTGNYCGD